MAAQATELPRRIAAGGRRGLRIDTLGLWLRDHQRAVRRLQWVIIAIYAALVIVPAFAPDPTRTSHIWSDVVLFAQFLFWGIWWPFVLVSMVLIGRTWCGVFCPEGALTEFVSARGLGRATPRWMKWRGWPFAGFVGVTVYGQMISVYQYPGPVIVILGGSTLAAIGVGYVYGRNKRVWCRYLCPVNGVFGLLAKLAPMRYAVDRAAWDEAARLALAGIVVRHAECGVPIPHELLDLADHRRVGKRDVLHCRDVFNETEVFQCCRGGTCRCGQFLKSIVHFVGITSDEST